MPMRPPPTRRLTTLATVTVAGLLTAGCAGPAGPVLDTVAAANDRLEDHRRGLAHGDTANAETGDDSATVSASDEPTLFGVPSSKLPFEPGEIDPIAHPDEQFNPCTEISPEVYRQAGIELKIEPDMDKLAGYVAGCMGRTLDFNELGNNGTQGTFHITSHRVPLGELEQRGYEVREVTEDSDFKPYLLGDSAERGDCASGVKTNRGYWDITFSPHRGKEGPAAACEHARSVQEKITKHMGESSR